MSCAVVVRCERQWFFFCHLPLASGGKTRGSLVRCHGAPAMFFSAETSCCVSASSREPLNSLLAEMYCSVAWVLLGGVARTCMLYVASHTAVVRRVRKTSRRRSPNRTSHARRNHWEHQTVKYGKLEFEVRVKIFFWGRAVRSMRQEIPHLYGYSCTSDISFWFLPYALFGHTDFMGISFPPSECRGPPNTNYTYHTSLKNLQSTLVVGHLLSPPHLLLPLNTKLEERRTPTT